jgi:two-component system response regulator PilR (NtrC family)
MEIDIHKIQEEIFLKSVLDTVSDGVTIIDKDLRIVFHNESIRQKFGTITGRLCYEAYRGRVEPCVDCLILKVMKDGKQRKVLSDTVLPNGDVRWMECASGPLKNKDGNIVGAVEIVRDVTEQMRLSKECTTLKREVERQAQFENIITQSKKMKTVFQLIEKIAPTTSTVLITGESGTGKELIARAIHTNSKRKGAPFISVNCSAIPENLLESELFGHVKGAFTGAIRSHKGLIPAADGGTLFLDEVGEIPLSLQAKLLRFLQEGTCRRIGDTETQKYDVRVISATNRNLEEAVKDNVLREDLFFRLNVIPIYLPPLRERKEDIPLLANHILQQMCDSHSRNVTGISSQTLKMMLDYSWPGNIRELQNIIEYALHVTEDKQTIKDAHLPPAMTSRDNIFDSQQKFISIEEFTKQSILALQSECTEEEIAEKLGISRKNLWEKRKRWDIPRPINKPL